MQRMTGGVISQEEGQVSPFALGTPLTSSRKLSGLRDTSSFPDEYAGEPGIIEDTRQPKYRSLPRAPVEAPPWRSHSVRLLRFLFTPFTKNLRSFLVALLVPPPAGHRKTASSAAVSPPRGAPFSARSLAARPIHPRIVHACIRSDDHPAKNAG